jgi:glutathione S-transferase
MFLANREFIHAVSLYQLSLGQVSLEANASAPEAAPFKEFYETKIAANGGLLAIYQGEATEQIKAGFFKKSQDHVRVLSVALNELLPQHLPAKGFIHGERPGEADFHVAAWITRIAATAGGKDADSGLKSLEASYGPLPEKVVAYWNSWVQRASWKKVYAAGLH